MSAPPVARLLIVDDEPAHLRALCRTLRGQGYDTEGFTAGQDALAALQTGRFDLLLTDLQMPGMDGIALMRAAQETDANLVSIIMTGQGAISTAVEAMRTGAFDYILKPLNLSMILSVLTRALSVRQLRLHNIALQEGLRLRTTELEAAQRELLEANAALERRVEQRTAALHAYAEKLRRLSHRLFETEETERRQLARELHDRVGQNLSVLGMAMGAIRAQLPEQVREQINDRLDDCATLLQSTADLIRDVMADLRPPGLDELGLFAALTGYARQTASRGKVPVWASGGEIAPRLPPLVEITLFRIAQEATINALKHARANDITLTLSSHADTATLVIADNGRGFDPEASHARALGHLGMVNMRERADAIVGTLRVESAPGAGTRVIVEVPRGARPENEQRR